MKTVLLLASFVAVAPLMGQATPNPWTSLKIKPGTFADARTVYVATPAGYRNPLHRFPVLVLLDADDQDQFAAAVANLRFLAGRAAIPELILVGVVNGKDRGHDLSPVASGNTAKLIPTAGGAATFVDFVLHDVLPVIRGRYRTIPATFLAGHSLGGLVALHAASTRPEFAGIIAMSPSLWWNDSTAAQGYADSLARLTRPLRLFVSSGQFEPSIDITAQRLIARLDSVKPPSLQYAYHHYGTASHGLTPQVSLIDGVQYLFAPMSVTSLPVSTLGPTADSAEIMHAYTASRETYIAGARSLGFDARALPEEQVNDLAYGVLGILKLPRVAVWLFRENVRDYPESSGVYSGLGDGLLAVGDTVSAKAQLRRGLELARKAGRPDSTEMKKKLAALAHRGG